MEILKVFKRFYPDEYYENAYIIDYKGLYVKGYRGIIFDVDNTLVEHGAPVNDKAKDLFAKLHEMGYETCIISNNSEQRVEPLARHVDNTLVEHGAPVNDKAKDLFAKLHEMGYETCIISNNSEQRVEPLARQVNSKYVSKAAKPSPKNYLKAMDIMGTDKADTYFVGDQIFTDVWGANRAGIKSILVKPIDKHEEIQIVLKRYLESIVLFFYKRYIKRRN